MIKTIAITMIASLLLIVSAQADIAPTGGYEGGDPTAASPAWSTNGNNGSITSDADTVTVTSSLAGWNRLGLDLSDDTNFDSEGQWTLDTRFKITDQSVADESAWDQIVFYPYVETPNNNGARKFTVWIGRTHFKKYPPGGFNPYSDARDLGSEWHVLRQTHDFQSAVTKVYIDDLYLGETDGTGNGTSTMDHTWGMGTSGDSGGTVVYDYVRWADGVYSATDPISNPIVPEPATLALLGAGSLLLIRRRK